MTDAPAAPAVAAVHPVRLTVGVGREEPAPTVELAGPATAAGGSAGAGRKSSSGN